jgi:Ca2+-binding EF-hand superfamily protein
MKVSELLKLKDCFNSLDQGGDGSIGLTEMQEPLIGLGFAQNVNEV